MQIEFNYISKELVVTFESEPPKVYLNSEDYLKDWPDRQKDCVAIGWEEKV